MGLGLLTFLKSWEDNGRKLPPARNLTLAQAEEQMRQRDREGAWVLPPEPKVVERSEYITWRS